MNKPVATASVYRRRNLWRVRLLAVGYFTALMTLTAPIPSVTAPALKPQPAVADEIDFKRYAAQVSREQYGWGETQMKCLRQLWGKESAWNPEADNPHSTAFGIAQMLGEDSTNPLEQIRNGLRYIQHRYEKPCNACCLLYTSPSPRDLSTSRMPSSA